MNARRATQLILAAAIPLGIAALFFLTHRERVGAVAPNRPGRPASSAPAASVPRPIENLSAEALAKADRESKIENLSGVSHLADDLNAPGGTVRRDLDILNEVFTTWQTNFPHTGNPVGENAEITTALTGGNPARFAFIPRGHRAINARGELCDRWGTPFRFHQLSGTQMEIRSAGPDLKFGTADDAEFAPAALFPVPR